MDIDTCLFAPPAPSGPPPLAAGRGRRAAFLLLLCLLLLAPAASPAAESGPAWLGYQRAIDLAGRTPRPVFLFFSAPWCYLCKKMQRLVFSDPALAARLDREAYPVLVDITQEPRLAQTYAIQQVPTTIILDGRGKVALRLTGYQDRATLRRALDFVGHGHHRRTTWEAYGARP